MSSTKSFINAFMLTIATLAIVSCVPKATEKKAVCGTNEAFSTVSRSCYSIEELRVKPVGTTATSVVSEESYQSITLAYTDANQDKALSCKVSSISSNLEMISPSFADNGVYNIALDVQQSAYNIAYLLGQPYSAMNDAFTKAFGSHYYPTAVSQLTIFRNLATNLINLGTGNTDANIRAWYIYGQEKLPLLNSAMTNMTNRCECTGGICKTVIVPKLNKTGSAGFSYTITDIDGESSVKAVSVTISALPALISNQQPVGQSAFYPFVESSTSVGTSYTVTIPDAGDIVGTPVTSYLYKFKSGSGFTRKQGAISGVTSSTTAYYGETPKGIVYGCMDLYPSTSATSNKNCIYVPNNGNDYDTFSDPVHPNASVAIGDLTFTAKASGATANNVNIQFIDIFSAYPSTTPIAGVRGSPQVYGLTNSAEAFVRVEGNNIKVYVNPTITTYAHVSALLIAHPQASKLISVTGGSATIAVPASANLINGLDAFDKIPFTVNNTKADSINDAAVTIRIISADDVPFMNAFTPVSNTVAIPEDQTPIIIDLSATYTDVDTVLDARVPALTYRNTCNVTTLDVAHPGTNFTSVSCTCVLGVCQATLTPTANASSTLPFTFQYRIGSLDTSTGITQYTAYRDYNLTIDPINDAPEISETPITSSTPASPLTTVPQVINEGSTGTLHVYVGPGGSGYESQTVTLAAVSSNLTLFPPGSITIVDVPPASDGHKLVTFTPVANQSGTATITFTATDSGNPTAPNVNVFSKNYFINVKAVNNPPVFMSSFTKVETNEGGAVQSDGFQIDEDDGHSTDEDYQYLTIDSITSDNTAVLPLSAIRFFYDLNDNGVEDSGESRCALNQSGCVTATATIDPVYGTDAKAHKLYLKLDPVDGISGNANIIMTISDNINTSSTVGVGDPIYRVDNTYAPLTNTINKTFSFIVHPTAALHGGWNNISSVGLKTDKNGAPVAASEIQCNYNKITSTGVVGDLKACAGQSCTEEYSPTGTITPDAANVIFWDSKAKRCYRSTANDKYSWVDFNTSCPITRTPSDATICSGNNCIDIPGTDIPKVAGLFRYDTGTNTCYVSNGKTAASDWNVQYVPAKVTLAWKNFVMVGSGADSSVQIAGWNVYRREAGADFNFKGGHLTSTTSNSTTSFTIPDPSIRTFTDTTAIAGKVYYYVVRPVDNKRLFPTFTPEIFSEVRVLAAPVNYSFVHRWAVNQEICNSMNITTSTTPSRVDPTRNYRCAYVGPGATSGYYDYGRDLLVDTQEVGCPYTKAPNCTANGCVGIGNPSSASFTGTVANGNIYYDRNSGSCYIKATGGWRDMSSALGLAEISDVVADSLRSSLNAPLVNITQSSADTICSIRKTPAGTGLIFPNTDRASLPNKKDYVGYSSQKLNVTDPEITEIEQGFSLNIQSRCNSSAASGLENAFTDSSIPSTSFMYSLPGTYSSNIRSLHTGSVALASSQGTEACVSRFGIQDLYGNVAEWTKDQMNCVGNSSYNECTASTPGTGESFKANDFLEANLSTSHAYGFNARTGPANDINDNKVVDSGDSVMTNWAFADLFYASTNFSLPLALPIDSDIADTYLNAPFLSYILNIGPSSGITVNKLHEDGIIINNSVLAGKTASFAVGGSYLSGTRAGRYSSELIESTVGRPDVGFRCIVPIPQAYYPVDAQHPYVY